MWDQENVSASEMDGFLKRYPPGYANTLLLCKCVYAGNKFLFVYFSLLVGGTYVLESRTNQLAARVVRASILVQ